MGYYLFLVYNIFNALKAVLNQFEGICFCACLMPQVLLSFRFARFSLACWHFSRRLAYLKIFPP